MWQSSNLTVGTGISPALALHAGKLHMVYADSNHALHHGVYTPGGPNGTGRWTYTPMTGQSTATVPSLVEYLGKLTCIYRGNTSPYNIYIAVLDDSTDTWSCSHAALTSNHFGPGAAVHDGLLYCAFAPGGSSSVSFATWDGHAWSDATLANTVANLVTSHSPTLAVYNGQLHLLYVNGTAVQHAVYTGTAVPNQPFIPLGPTGLTTANNLGAAAWNGLLYTLLKSNSGSSVNQIVCATYDGARWSAAAPTVAVDSSSGPAVAAQGDALQIVAPTTPYMTQIVGAAGGSAPLSRLAYAEFAGQAALKTGVPYQIFGGARAYTVEAWVNVSATGGTQFIASSFDAAAGTGLMALAVKDGKFAAWRNGPWLPSQTVIVPKQWYHVALSYDGNAYTCLYIDGNLENTDIDTRSAFPASTGPVTIGAASNGASGAPTQYLQGAVRWAAIWTVARSSEEIQGDLYVQPRPQPGLLALYDLAGGTPADISGHGQTASVSGTLTYAAQTAGLVVSGRDGLDCGTGNTLSFAGNQAMSIEAWVRPTSVPGTGYVLLRDGEYSLGLDAGGWFGSFGSLRVSRGPAVANQWTHLCFTWLPSCSGGTGTLYVNGSQAGSSSTSAIGNPKNDNHTTIGCSATAQGGFVGGIASVTVWSTALSSNEVLAAMTQSPIGMQGLAANYDFSTAPLQDATVQNDPPTAIGAPVLGYVTEESLSATAAAQVAGVDTGVSIPYYPLTPAQGYAFTSPPVLPIYDASQVPRSIDAVLTPGYFQSLLDAFHRSLPPSVTADARRVLAAEHTAKLERLFFLARQNPRHLAGAHRFEWVHRGSNLVLLHHSPQGEIAEVGVFDAKALTPQQAWWIQFALTLTFGFANILGVSTPNTLAASLTLYILQNPQILTILSGAVDPRVGISVDTAFGALAALWNGKYLQGMLKIVLTSMSWWAIAKLFLKLAAMFIPGAQEILVATMLVQFTVMAVQLSLLAVEYPRS